MLYLNDNIPQATLWVKLGGEDISMSVNLFSFLDTEVRASVWSS